MTVYLLCGRIASGKSTYAASLDAVTLSCDELMLSLFDSCLGSKHNDVYKKCEEYFYTLSLDILKRGADVCLDFGFSTKAEREHARSFYSAEAANVRLVYFDVPRRERILRLEERNRKLKNSTRREYIITEQMLDRFDSGFEEPTDEEDFEYGNTQI
ncbi:MAG: ATP-binding protein [Clostridia bacterium]|nr:ATP-binding protein [Clostridia bacterium]